MYSLHLLCGVCVHVFVKLLLQKQEGSQSCTALEHAAVIMAVTELLLVSAGYLCPSRTSPSCPPFLSH